MVKPMTPAQKQLAEDHMDLVPKIIRSMTNGSPLTSEQRQELCQIGYLALCRAAFSCGEGFPFTPYAAAAIRNAIYDSWPICRAGIASSRSSCSGQKRSFPRIS